MKKLNPRQAYEKLLKRSFSHNERIEALETKTKIFRGILVQSGTDAPTMIILENDFDEVPTLARSGAGAYSINTVADVFTEDKTFWSGFVTTDATDDKIIGVEWSTAKKLSITQAVATVATDVVEAVPFAIEVYP